MKHSYRIGPHARPVTRAHVEERRRDEMTTKTREDALAQFKQWLLDQIGDADIAYHDADGDGARERVRLDTLYDVEKALLDAGLLSTGWTLDEHAVAWKKFPFTLEYAGYIGAQWWLDDHVGAGPYEWKTEDGQTWVRRKEAAQATLNGGEAL